MITQKITHIGDFEVLYDGEAQKLHLDRNSKWVQYSLDLPTDRVAKVLIPNAVSALHNEGVESPTISDLLGAMNMDGMWLVGKAHTKHFLGHLEDCFKKNNTVDIPAQLWEEFSDKLLGMVDDVEGSQP